MSLYIHHVPGRLRIRAPELGRFPERAACICTALHRREGIESVTLNQRAGSIIINYDRSTLEVDDIMQTLKEHGCLESSHIATLRPQLETKAGNLLGKALFGVLLEKTVERSVMSLIAALK